MCSAVNIYFNILGRGPLAPLSAHSQVHTKGASLWMVLSSAYVSFSHFAFESFFQIPTHIWKCLRLTGWLPVIAENARLTYYYHTQIYPFFFVGN